MSGAAPKSSLAATPTGVDILNAVNHEDDFGHEVRVGATIRSIPAFTIKHGGTYADSVTGKPRQFDYRCWLQKEASRLALAVECKNLRTEFPLIVTGLARSNDEAFVDLVQSTTGHHKHGNKTVVGTSSFTRRTKGESCFYPPKSFVGKSLFRVKIEKGVPVTAGDSDVYDKWSQALASALALVHNACEQSRDQNLQKLFTAVLPVVVVPDDTLWKLEYSDDGTVRGNPTKIHECEYFVGRTMVAGLESLEHRFVFSHLHFFTMTGFKSFLSKLAAYDGYWESLFSTNGEVVLL